MNLSLDFVNIEEIVNNEDYDLRNIDDISFETEYMGGHYYTVDTEGCGVAFGEKTLFSEVAFIEFCLHEHPRAVKLENDNVAKTGIANRLGAALVREAIKVVTPFTNDYVEYFDNGIRLQIYCNKKGLVEFIRLVNDACIERNSDWEKSPFRS